MFCTSSMVTFKPTIMTYCSINLTFGSDDGFVNFFPPFTLNSILFFLPFNRERESAKCLLLAASVATS